MSISYMGNIGCSSRAGDFVCLARRIPRRHHRQLGTFLAELIGECLKAIAIGSSRALLLAL